MKLVELVPINRYICNVDIFSILWSFRNIGVLGQVWYLILLIPDLSLPLYSDRKQTTTYAGARA